MDVTPPTYGNPPLPWRELPTWLRVLRILLFVTWGAGMACGAGALFLQDQVLESPTAAVGQFTHPVEFKGSVFYLTGSLRDVWVPLQPAFLTLSFVGLILIVATKGFEYRIKRQRWNAAMDARANKDGRLDHP